MHGISTRSVDGFVKALRMSGVSKSKSAGCVPSSTSTGGLLQPPDRTKRSGTWCRRPFGTAFVRETAEAARTQWRSVADQLRDKVSKLGALMDEAEDDVPCFLRSHWSEIYPINPLERSNAAIKRHTNVVGIFRNDSSIVQQLGAMLLYCQYQLRFLSGCYCGGGAVTGVHGAGPNPVSIGGVCSSILFLRSAS